MHLVHGLFRLFANDAINHLLETSISSDEPFHLCRTDAVVQFLHFRLKTGNAVGEVLGC